LGEEDELGAQLSLVVGQGRLDTVVELLGVPDGAIFFQELEDFFQDYLGVGRSAGVLDFETVADGFGCGLLDIQRLLRCKGRELDRSFLGPY
jgi:hypothetical protein